MMKKALLTSIAVLSVLSAPGAHATESYVARCGGLLVHIFGRNGYSFSRYSKPVDGPDLPNQSFHMRKDGTWMFRRHKCKYVKNLLY
jgi:hypothetical protein